MNTTKLLCRIFDRRKKGYVECGDVFDVMPSAFAAVVAVVAYLYGGYCTATRWELMTNGAVDVVTAFESIQVFCMAVFVSVSVVGVCAAVILIPLFVCVSIYDRYRYKRIVTCKKEK